MARYRNLFALVPVFAAGFALLCALTVPGTAAAQSGGPAHTSKAQTAIEKVLEEQATAWNRGDVDAFVRGYENSPQTAIVGQKVEYGYDLILAHYKSAYGSPAAMGKLSFQNLNIRLLGKDYAVVTGNFQLVRTREGGGDARGIFSLVFARSSAGWKIILDHTS